MNTPLPTPAEQLQLNARRAEEAAWANDILISDLRRMLGAAMAEGIKLHDAKRHALAELARGGIK